MIKFKKKIKVKYQTSHELVLKIIEDLLRHHDVSGLEIKENTVRFSSSMGSFKLSAFVFQSISKGIISVGIAEKIVVVTYQYEMREFLFFLLFLGVLFSIPFKSFLPLLMALGGFLFLFILNYFIQFFWFRYLTNRIQILSDKHHLKLLQQ